MCRYAVKFWSSESAMGIVMVVTSASANEYTFLSRFMIASTVRSWTTGTSFTGRTVTFTVALNTCPG